MQSCFYVMSVSMLLTHVSIRLSMLMQLPIDFFNVFFEVCWETNMRPIFVSLNYTFAGKLIALLAL